MTLEQADEAGPGFARPLIRTVELNVRLATTQTDRNNFRTVGGYTIGNVD